MPRFYDPDEDTLVARMERNARLYDQYRLTTTPSMARNISQMASVWGRTLKPGAVYSLGAAGLEYDSEPVQIAVQGGVRQRNRSIWDKVGDTVSGAFAAAADPVGDVLETGYDVAKGFSRGMFAGLSFAPEMIQASGRALMNERSDSFSDLLDQTTAGAGHDEIKARGGYLGLLTGSTDVDYGDGFFVQAGSQANSRVGRRQRDAALAAGRRGDGRAISLGRSFADLFMEDSGAKRHRILSGLLDGAVALVDPSVVFGGTAVKGIKGSRQLTRGDWAEVAGTAVQDTPAKAKARAFGVGQATAQEFSEDALRLGSDNPSVRALRDKVRAGLITKGEMAQEVSRLRKQIEVDAGLVPGITRRTAVPEQAAKWLESDDFHHLAEKLSEMDNFNEIRRLTGKKLPVQLVDELASQAHTPDQVKDAIARAINQGSLTEKFGLADVGKVRRRVHTSRLAARLPGTHLILDDPDEMVEFADRYMRSAHLDENTINTHAQAFAHADSRQAKYQAFDSMMKSVEKKLISEGTDPLIARGVTRAWERYKDDVAYNLDRLGNEEWMTKVVVNGRVVEMPHPHLYREYVNRHIPLPNLREIRKLSSNPVVRALLDENQGTATSKVGSTINELADVITNQVWTPLRLIRGGFVIRNIAEAQMRMATGGYDNAFTDPLAFLAWAVGDGTSKTAKLMAKAGVKTGRGSIDPTGASYKRKSELARGADEFGRALSKNGSLWRTASGKRKVGGFVRVTQDKGDEFLEGWAAELSDLAMDDVASVLLDARNLDEAKHWFYFGEGRKFYDDLAQDDDFLKRFGGKAGADAYIDSVWKRIQDKTGGSVELLDLMRTGRLQGVSLWNKDHINAEVLPLMRELLDFAPEVVKGSRMTYRNAENEGHWKRFVDSAFDLIASRPENFMNNSPVFRQEHWRRTIALAGHLRPEDQARLVENAKQAKLPKDLLKQLDRNVKERKGQLSLDDVNKLAAQRALQAQRKLLYNAYDKQQFFDVARAFFVFGDALRNTAQVWPQLLMQNPGAVGRFGLGFQGMRESDIDGDGRGFFYRDPTTNQEVFAFPFTSKLVEVGTGLADTPFQAPVSGLNLLTQSVVPSLGPVSAFAASAVVPDRVELDGIRKIMLPYGEPDLVNQALPPFLAKVVTGLTEGWSPEQTRQFASTVAEVVRHLESTGQYDLGDPEDYEDLLADAKSKAKWLFIWRGAAQFFAPSPPSPKHIAYDKDGKVWETAEMARVYRQYIEEYGLNEAMPRFIEEFGQFALSATVSKTESEGTSPANKEALDFVRANPEVARRFKKTYGLFLNGDGPFDYTAYQRQIDSGERTVKDPDAYVAEVRQRLARSLYEAAKEIYGDSPEMLRAVREQLETRFEFNNLDFNMGGSKTMILELQQAVQEPALRNTEAGQALALYLQARERALAVAKERGVSSLATNKDAADLRAYLSNVGRTAVEEFPAFAQMWERVFAREVGEV
jgi:hypothetical protein